LKRVTFSGNSATQRGGGLDNDAGSCPLLVNAVFSGNTALDGGGVANVNRSHATLVNAALWGNTASGGNGGGMYNSSSWPTLVQVTMSGNSATGSGGGIYHDTGSYFEDYTVRNSILWGNTAASEYETNWIGEGVAYSLVYGWHDPAHHVYSDRDPRLVDVPGGDLRLGPGSGAIDAGDNDALPTDALDLDSDGDTAEALPLDLDGNPRLVDCAGRSDTGSGTPPLVDMGAYEVDYEVFVLHLPLICR
jgi:predicted outer membrane repeat protein